MRKQTVADAETMDVLKQYASATGIVRLAKKKLGEDVRPTILNKSDVTAKDVFDAVKAGD